MGEKQAEELNFKMVMLANPCRDMDEELNCMSVVLYFPCRNMVEELNCNTVVQGHGGEAGWGGVASQGAAGQERQRAGELQAVAGQEASAELVYCTHFN